MPDLWRVAAHEYRRTVVRRGFLNGTLAVPVGLAVLVVIAILGEIAGEDRRPVGYVDEAGRLTASQPAGPDQIEVRAYADQAAALDALRREELQAVFILPADYRQTRRTDLYYLSAPPANDVWGQFDDFLRAHLVAGLPAEAQTRVLAGPQVTMVDPVSGRSFSESGIINIILPVAASFLFFITTLSASGYLLRVVADEKENRTMEVMLTSLSPAALIGGKTLGLLGAVLTQLASYFLASLVGLWIAGQYVPELARAVVPWDYLGVMALYFLPTFGLLTAVMVAVGAALPDVQQGQQIVGLFNLAFLAPIFALTVILENPSHPLAVFLTLFPTSAFMTISLRWGLGAVPFWQLAVSWLLLIGSALAVAWAAARIFRLGMLSYGQAVRPRTIWAALRGE
ncbi:MAG: ABC transporter permease [Anaerolineales bacterium]|nr:ABC transporter permease [Anaerolineales bacterium]